MNRTIRNSILRYAAAVVIGAIMVFLVLDLHGYTALTTQADRYRTLSNAFTIPGTIITMLGLLVLISGTDAFDGITYVLSWLRLTLLPFGKQERYIDHVKRRRARKKPKGGFLIITGLAYLLVAVVFLILFYQVYRK